MLGAGMLDERVSFFRPQTYRNEYGEQVTEWALAYTCWARVQWKRGARALEDGEVWHSGAVSVTLRYTDKVDDGMRMAWNGSEYYIDSLNGSRSDGTLAIVAVKIRAEDRAATEGGHGDGT